MDVTDKDVIQGTVIPLLDSRRGSRNGGRAVARKLPRPPEGGPAVKRPHPLRAILLARVSTTKVEQANSPDRQIANLREQCRRRGWDVVELIVEKASGRQILSRPPVVRALERIFAYQADVLCVDHLSRLGRNAKEALEVLDLLHQVGAQLFDAHSEIDTSLPFGRFMFTLSASLHELDTAEYRRLILEGLERARARGTKLGKPQTFPDAAAKRARELRRVEKANGAIPSWAEVALMLQAEGFGKHSRGAISRAVGRLTEREPDDEEGAA